MFFCSAVLQAFGFFFLIFAKTKATEWPKARIPIFCFCSYVGGYVYDDGKKFFFFFFFFFFRWFFPSDTYSVSSDNSSEGVEKMRCIFFFFFFCKC